MINEKMTVHEALGTLKMLDARITSAIGSFVPCTTNRHSNTKIGKNTIEEFRDNTKAAFSSITDMMKRRSAIKKSVIASNATTVINVRGVDMTVAEAIEAKTHGNTYLRQLYSKIVSEYDMCCDKAESQNGQRLSMSADQYVVSLYGGKDNAVSGDTSMKARDMYIAANTIDVIDPIDCAKTADEYMKYIEEFEAELDSKLSVSNAVTVINVEY